MERKAIKKWEGCPEEFKEAIENDIYLPGYAWDEDSAVAVECCLQDYNSFAELPFAVIDDHSVVPYKNFSLLEPRKPEEKEVTRNEVLEWVKKNPNRVVYSFGEVARKAHCWTYSRPLDRYEVLNDLNENKEPICRPLVDVVKEERCQETSRL